MLTSLRGEAAWRVREAARANILSVEVMGGEVKKKRTGKKRKPKQETRRRKRGNWHAKRMEQPKPGNVGVSELCYWR